MISQSQDRYLRRTPCTDDQPVARPLLPHDSLYRWSASHKTATYAGLLVQMISQLQGRYIHTLNGIRIARSQCFNRWPLWSTLYVTENNCVHWGVPKKGRHKFWVSCLSLGIRASGELAQLPLTPVQAGGDWLTSPQGKSPCTLWMRSCEGKRTWLDAVE
jgi:hypothetical protein